MASFTINYNELESFKGDCRGQYVKPLFTNTATV